MKIRRSRDRPEEEKVLIIFNCLAWHYRAEKEKNKCQE